MIFRNHPLNYWIDVAEYQSHTGSPLLIVQTKCDQPEQEELRFPTREKALEVRRYRKQLHVSAKENRGRDTLRETLRYPIAWLRNPARLGQAQIGAGRLRVQRRLEALHDADMALPPRQRQHQMLEMWEFEAICAEEGGDRVFVILSDKYLRSPHCMFELQRFYTQVPDILGTLADIVQPRSFDDLKRYGFNDLPG